MRIGEFELTNPVMPAGGVAKTLGDVEQLASTDVGAILAGSYTLEERPFGNSPNGETVYYHDPDTGATYNSIGLRNPGAEKLAEDLPEMVRTAHEAGKPFVLNIAPMSEDPVEEVIEITEKLAKSGVRNLDGLELNASCPNVVTADGGRHEQLSHHPELLGSVLLELGRIGEDDNGPLPFSTLLVRIAPFREKQDAAALVGAVVQSGVDIVSAFNTFAGGRPLDAAGTPILQVPNGIGGQSGRAKIDEAEEQTRWLVEARSERGANFDILGSNGIVDAETMRRRLDIGAAAVSCTTIFWESKDWNKTVRDLLDGYAAIRA